jgi:hypothetical protein
MGLVKGLVHSTSKPSDAKLGNTRRRRKVPALQTFGDPECSLASEESESLGHVDPEYKIWRSYIEG